MDDSIVSDVPLDSTVIGEISVVCHVTLESVVCDETLDTTVVDEESALCDVTLDTSCEDSCDVTLDSCFNSQRQIDDMLPQLCSTPTKIAVPVSVQDGNTFSDTFSLCTVKIGLLY